MVSGVKVLELTAGNLDSCCSRISISFSVNVKCIKTTISRIFSFKVSAFNDNLSKIVSCKDCCATIRNVCTVFNSYLSTVKNGNELNSIRFVITVNVSKACFHSTVTCNCQVNVIAKQKNFYGSSIIPVSGDCVSAHIECEIDSFAILVRDFNYSIKSNVFKYNDCIAVLSCCYCLMNGFVLNSINFSYKYCLALCSEITCSISCNCCLGVSCKSTLNVKCRAICQSDFNCLTFACINLHFTIGIKGCIVKLKAYCSFASVTVIVINPNQTCVDFSISCINMTGVNLEVICMNLTTVNCDC